MDFDPKTEKMSFTPAEWALLGEQPNSIFRKTRTPLTSWFYAIYLFSVAKNGVSAKELERHLGVTYKTAWRMCKQIRILMRQENEKLTGSIEMDETYIGGKHRKR